VDQPLKMIVYNNSDYCCVQMHAASHALSRCLPAWAYYLLVYFVLTIPAYLAQRGAT
jgi:hypothetical protein